MNQYPPGTPQGFGQPALGQPGFSPGQSAYPGAAPAPAYPSDLKTVAILQIVSAGLMILVGSASYAMFVLTFVISSMGLGIIFVPVIGLFYLYALAVAVLHAVSGIKTLSGTPYQGRFWWSGLPIMAICSFLVGDVFTGIVGVVTLVIAGKPEIRARLGTS